MSPIIAILTRKRPPAAVAYGLTLALVVAVWAFGQAFHPPLHRYLPFMPVIFVAALAFDRNTGIFATLASALFADRYYLLSPDSATATDPLEWLFLLLFLGAGFGIAYLVEALSRAVRRLRAAEEEKSLLLDELAHRMRNDLMMISQVLAFQAGRQNDPEARAVLESAVARVHVVAEAQERLHSAGKQGQVEVASYLEALGQSLADLLRDVRPIDVRVEAAALMVPASIAVSIGLITNELVTNSFKHAFPGGRGGTVLVRLEPSDDGVLLTVEDDGVGCQSPQREGGLGSRLVQLLVSHMGGQLQRDPAPKGHRVRVMLPIHRAAARKAKAVA